MKKQNFMLDAIVVGLALFSTFFGAGNLIFPPAVGLESGSAWVMGALGLLLSAIICPVPRLVKAIGKEPVEVNEAPGFVVNKILVPMINEACDLVYTGVASVEGVDIAMKLGANHPMGPLALGDLIGLDVCLAVMDTLYNESHDSKYRASLLMRKMVRAGKLGRKTGSGFYDYTK